MFRALISFALYLTGIFVSISEALKLISTADTTYNYLGMGILVIVGAFVITFIWKLFTSDNPIKVLNQYGIVGKGFVTKIEEDFLDSAPEEIRPRKYKKMATATAKKKKVTKKKVTKKKVAKKARKGKKKSA